MRGFLAIGAVGLAATIGYVNRKAIYDKRIGLLWLTKVCHSFQDSVSLSYLPNTPLQGLDCPLEAMMMVLVEKESNKIVMSLGQRSGKNPEWTMVSGKVESWKRDEDERKDYSNERFIVNGSQLSADECEDIVFENPRSCLAREVVEELIGTKEPLTKEQLNEFAWLVSKIHQNSDWTFVKTSKSVKLDDNSKIEGFNTYMGLCRIVLTTEELSNLNSQIQKYGDREHREFSAKSWSVKEIEKSGNTTKNFEVSLDSDYPIRTYNKIMFSHYADQFNELIKKQ